MKSKRKTHKSENKFLSVVLPVELFAKLEKAAKDADRSKSKYVELLLRRHLGSMLDAMRVQ